MRDEERERLADLRRLATDATEGTPRASAGARLAMALRSAGRRSEALTVAQIAADEFARLDASAGHAQMGQLAGELLCDLHRYDESARRLAETRHLFELTNADGAVIARCERMLADVARRRGRLEEAERWLASAFDRYTELGADLAAARCDHDLGVLRHALGDLSAAVAILRSARSAFLGLRDREGVASSGFNLGVVLHDQEQHEEAIGHYQQARSIFAAMGQPADAAACDQNIAAVLFATGRDDEAARRLHVARAAYHDLGLMRPMAECDADLAQVLRRSGRADAASAYLARARSEGVEDPSSASASA